MVARTWHGAVPVEKSDEYLKLMRSDGLEGYKSIPGNRGAFVFRRFEGNVAHFILVSFWESKDAIKTYAGDIIDIPRYASYDREYLLELESSVQHHDVYSE